MTADDHAFLEPHLLNPNGLGETEEGLLRELLRMFMDSLNKLRGNGPSAQLWVQHFEMVILIKQFVDSERSGKWELHLESIQKMIPFFHACGHFLYTKSAHLYLQDILDLQEKLNPDEYPSSLKKATSQLGVWTSFGQEFGHT